MTSTPTCISITGSAPTRATAPKAAPPTRPSWRDAKTHLRRESLEVKSTDRNTPEGLEECFTINRLDVPRSLHRCLATSNVMDNPHWGVRSRTRRVCRWRPGTPTRSSSSALLDSEKSYRKIMGYRDLWVLKAILDRSQPATRQAVA
jgi:hypothetical protein